ncbi:polyamine oxidase 1-like isoform X1 [Silene latifolia]
MAMDKALTIQEFGAKLSETNQETNQEDMSILDMQRLYNWMPTNPLEKLIDYYYYDYEDGEPPEATSLKHTLPRREFNDFGDAQNFIVDPRGFESLVHLLGKQFLTYTNEVVNDNRVKLNQVVSEIYYTDNGVTIKTEDELIYEAKVCIVSVSLGVLQNNLIKFNPELPGWKRRAICEFSIASFTKIFLKFPYAFWPTGPGTEFFLYAHERRGYYPIWKHYENEMPESNILMVMTSGEESMRIEQQSDEETKIEAMEVLRKIYGDGVPEAEDIFVSRWNSNKFYKGAFSNWPPNYTTQQHAQLQAPIGPVYFTGEHTSLEHFGCVEGAYYAGCTTGKEVIKYLQQGV